MIPDFTKAQLETLEINRNRPLIICDVDDVIVHFLRAFEAELHLSGLWLDPASFRLNGNVRTTESNTPIADHHLEKIVDQFFHDRTHALEPIDDAIESLVELSQKAEVVLLTNLPHHARDKRIHNMRALGLPFPVITNSGPKGPAIAHLAAETDHQSVFIDDNPGFILSAREHAKNVHLVHFLHDHRFARHHTPYEFASLTTDAWSKALPHIRKLIA